MFAAAVAGACLGFAWFNAHPAQVFMGDTGALALGGAIGALAVLTRTQLALPIIVSIFVDRDPLGDDPGALFPADQREADF